MTYKTKKRIIKIYSKLEETSRNALIKKKTFRRIDNLLLVLKSVKTSNWNCITFGMFVSAAGIVEPLLNPFDSIFLIKSPVDIISCNNTSHSARSLQWRTILLLSIITFIVFCDRFQPRGLFLLVCYCARCWYRKFIYMFDSIITGN